MISLGWDPGLFSLNRVYAESILSNGKTYTLTYGKDEKGDYIAFGRLYDIPVRYRDVGELLNESKIENHFLREILTDL